MTASIGPRYAPRHRLPVASATVRDTEVVAELLGKSVRYVEDLRERHVKEARLCRLHFAPARWARYVAEMREELGLAPSDGGLTPDAIGHAIPELHEAVEALVPLLTSQREADRRRAKRELLEARGAIDGMLSALEREDA